MYADTLQIFRKCFKFFGKFWGFFWVGKGVITFLFVDFDETLLIVVTYVSTILFQTI